MDDPKVPKVNLLGKLKGTVTSELSAEALFVFVTQQLGHRGKVLIVMVYLGPGLFGIVVLEAIVDVEHHVLIFRDYQEVGV